MAVHSYARSAGLDTDIFVANSLVDMYAKSGSLVGSAGVFDGMISRDVISWTSMVLGYADCGGEEMALEALAQMHLEGCKPNSLTFAAALKACGKLAARETWTEIQGRRVKLVALERGMALHSQSLKQAKACDEFLLSSLVDLYGRCGSLADARHVFGQTRSHPVPLTSLMLGYTGSGEARTALELFEQERKAVDARAFVAASRACKALAEEEEARALDGKSVKVGALETCMAIHSAAARYGVDSSTYLTSCLIEVYAGCGSLVDAVTIFNQRKFQDVFSWTALILAYVGNGQGGPALQAFKVMQRSPCFSFANARCCAVGLAACGASGDSEAARKNWHEIYRRGIERFMD
ncbi:pentatricopeptide repeat-containing protein At2g29760, chloroplastic-like [Selaginella moellendorffii]|uniref:pentatricopeptide repeat-containing protein At2g29760, chloroplastic-like n=1 Tax=Selaginella moellendorffii TaxID=88036 RepID=UPI000D1D03D5|nr:pentatricopeptide repeat-containing protein At2g29760, chloroplastic-like [Selaginella moellendorffii]|eukprot:XP_024519049.1 pentatricopeptide repeat-containing protein At2g29760, chloroplastic-like [Selaginella moellendorffii]